MKFHVSSRLIDLGTKMHYYLLHTFEYKLNWASISVESQLKNHFDCLHSTRPEISAGTRASKCFRCLCLFPVCLLNLFVICLLHVFVVCLLHLFFFACLKKVKPGFNQYCGT